ncbi:MAG: hypothetical protein ABQ298_03750 [Puniceicoccaceae bacterium]
MTDSGSINTKELAIFGGLIEETIKVSNRDQVTELRDQARLASQNAMRSGGSPFTPPKNKGQGENAVLGDLTKIVTLMTPEGYEYATSQWGFTDVNITGTSRTGEPYTIAYTTATLSMDELAAYHLSRRNRKGRTTGSAKEPGILTTFDVFERYLKEVQARVGSAKAGFGVAVLHYGGSVPGWIRRNIRAGSGAVDDQATKDPKSIRISNATAWARNHPDAKRVVRKVLRMRSKDMANKLIKAHQANFTLTAIKMNRASIQASMK